MGQLTPTNPLNGGNDINGLYASLGAMPPYGQATWDWTYNTDRPVSQMMLVTIFPPRGHFDVAGNLNALTILTAALGQTPQADSAGTVLDALQVLQQIPDFVAAVRALSERDPGGFVRHLVTVLSDDQQAGLLRAALSKLGIQVSAGALSQLLQVRHWWELLQMAGDEIGALVANSEEGQITFNTVLSIESARLSIVPVPLLSSSAPAAKSPSAQGSGSPPSPSSVVPASGSAAPAASQPSVPASSTSPRSEEAAGQPAAQPGASPSVAAVNQPSQGATAAGSDLTLTTAGTGGELAAGLNPSAPAGCHLNTAAGSADHVVYIQFDNVHFSRDNPNVPSDLEQMPHLLHFLTANGVLLANSHTPLIAHTATDILTTLTGLYPSSHGIAAANDYRYFKPDGSVASEPAFAYWMAKMGSGAYNLVTSGGANTPAPWAVFTRAGCNVGAIATANMVLENTADIAGVFGADSAQAAEAKTDEDEAQADYVGLAIHCAKASDLCKGGRPDILPSEPGGYEGFAALFGHKAIAPLIGGPLTDLAGNPIQDDKGRPGFPGFDGMSAAVSLAYAAAMQEHGVPVTYAYISDAHDDHTAGRAFGPGEKGYVAQLKAYDDAFAAFFDRLQKDGIGPDNTLFVAATDEGDHFVGSGPAPAGCDGVNTPCTWSTIGQLAVDLPGLLAREANIRTPLTIRSDSSPTLYLAGNPPPDSPAVRALERALATQAVDNPLSGASERPVNFLADATEMRLLHMVAADAARTPTLAVFAKPDYYLTATAGGCRQSCIAINPKAAWDHGTIDPSVNTVWTALAGPGIKKLGLNRDVWADEPDVRPTMMAALGLRDAYVHDGRALLEVLDDRALPKAALDQRQRLIELGQLYARLNAPVGEVGLASLRFATAALAGDAAAYKSYAGSLSAFTKQRDDLAGRIMAVLEGTLFKGQAASQQEMAQLSLDAQQLTDQISPAPPVLSSVSPTTVIGSSFALRATGNGFDSTGAVVEVYQPDGTFMGNGTVTSQSSTQIVTAQSMAGAAPGTYTIKVKNPDGQRSGGLTLTLYDRVSLSPSSGNAGTVFGYTGQGFTGSFGVTSHLKRPDGTELPTKQIATDSSGQFSDRIDSTGFAGGAYEAWAVDNNTSVSSAHATFTVAAPVAPVLNSLSPPAVIGSSFTLTVTGSGFDSAGAVAEVYQPNGTFMGNGTVTSRSSTQIVTAQSMAGAAPGNYTIKVKNPDGQRSGGLGLTLYDQVSVSPGSGSAGTAFSYTGQGFTGSFGVTSHVKRPDGTELPTKQIPTDGSGHFSDTINSTGFAAGTYEVWAIDNNTGVSSSHVTFAVH